MKGIHWRGGWVLVAAGVVVGAGMGASDSFAAVQPAAACRVDVRAPAAKGPVGARAVQGPGAKTAGLGFAATRTGEGRVQVEGRLGDLSFRKSVDHVGRVAVDLEAARDTLHLEMDERGISLTRDRETVRLLPGSSSEAEFDAARRMLGGSQAAGLLRAAAARVMEMDDDAADSVAVLMVDAVVGMLSGDVGAPGRLAKHLPRHALERTRRAAVVLSNCYTTWEQNTLIASYEWEDCALSFSIWDPIRHVCAFRWALQVESYWFSFLTCSGLSGLG